MKRPNHLSLRFLSNLIIGISLLMFVVILMPFLTSYLFPSKISAINYKEGMHVVIPRINAASRIFANVDPWNEAEYRKVLEHGVAHAKGTSLPGQSGMIFLFAHSSGMPWEIMRQNVVFLRLDDLQVDDNIVIYNERRSYNYKVIEKKYVSPSDVSSVFSEKRNVLILQTCWPIGTDWKRLLVFAKPKISN